MLVGVGGAIGSILRYLLGLLFTKYTSNGFPWATFSVNIIGSFAIGYLMAYLAAMSQQQDLKMLLVTGLCGGFTTFSAFTFENIKLIQSGQTTIALIYIFASILLGVAAVFFGMQLAK